MNGAPRTSRQSTSPIPPDDLTRNLTLAQPDKTESLRHIGLVGDTYTILLAGADTAGRYCVIDMHIPPGGGPLPHRHDFEESFILLEGAKSIIKAGDTVNIPANAPHQFHNASSKAVRLLCICSPSGQEDFFLAVGVLVKTRTTPPPKLDAAAQAELKTKVEALAPKYKTELLQHA
jgi:mannose-6-phosphate isomerase-like protein (cupin superfamily)